MTIHTGSITRFAGAFAAIVAVFGGFLTASPAMAYYGALQGTQPLSAVCDGRYDPNCILKETAYENQLSAPYTQWNNYTYQPPAYPQTYAPAYASNSYYYPTTQYQYSYPSTYSYQYSYQYAYPSTYYVAPTTYYVAPTTYGYDNSYDNYDNGYYDDSCDSYSSNCGY